MDLKDISSGWLVFAFGVSLPPRPITMPVSIRAVSL